ncbi:MAG: hypothetical protein BRD46_03870 [Bacteroidetes bacterium QS_8_68_15]|nr:MAG: hypothetical protein BRD46_03870 [Bacteroidetes bacterium QS_8_68_15]
MKSLLSRAPSPPRSLAPALLLTFAVAACGSPFSDAPSVADSTLVSALAELHLADARSQRRRADATDRRAPPLADSLRTPLSPAVRDSILARYGMTSDQLRAALTYYVRHPEQYTALYGRVVDTLSAERKALRFGPERGDDARPERPTPSAFRGENGAGE